MALKAAKLHGTKVKNACTVHLPIVTEALGGGAGNLGRLMDPDTLKSLRYLATNVSTLALKGEALEIAEAVARLDRLLVPVEAAVVQTCLPAVRKVMEQQKAGSGAYDFDEIIAGVAGALDKPGGEALIHSLRDRYKYALIDEFQDTDELQWKVFEEVFTKSPRDHRAYLIGDPKQSIYGFRGADVRTYLKARSELIAPGQIPIELRRNFRSTAAMIEACNLIFDQKDDEPFFDSTEINYRTPALPGQGDKLSALNANDTPSVPVHVLEIQPKGEKLTIGELRRALHPAIAAESPPDAGSGAAEVR